ncbi:MAG: DnaB-like helicase C-terminal domain-containing protein, partial [Pseudomonadota bacterium]
MADAVINLNTNDNDPAKQLYREAPGNIEAEQALLGAVLVNNDAFYRVSDFLKPEHFLEPLHRNIYKVAGDQIRLGKTSNPVTIKTFLPADEKIGDITVAAYLARLAAEAVTIINAEDYGRAIYDLAIRRALIGIGEDMVNEAYDSPVEEGPSDQIENAEKRLFELAETGRYDGGFQPFTDAVSMAIEMANAAFQRDGHLSGISTGIHSLDARMGGLQPSDLIILAGRPGMGKTSLATNIAYNIAASYRGEQQSDGSMKAVDGGVVGFYSLEMSSEQLATRIISEQTEISSSKIRRGEINEADF